MRLSPVVSSLTFAYMCMISAYVCMIPSHPIRQLTFSSLQAVCQRTFPDRIRTTWLLLSSCGSRPAASALVLRLLLSSCGFCSRRAASALVVRLLLSSCGFCSRRGVYRFQLRDQEAARKRTRRARTWPGVSATKYAHTSYHACAA